MGIKVTVTVEGLGTVLSNLDGIAERAKGGVIKQTALLANDTQNVWENATPSRSGKLRAEDVAEAGGMQFTLINGTYYYPFVNEGHMTPRGWRTKRGFRAAKRRSHVAGHFMTEAATDFISGNILKYLAKFLEDA